MCEMCGNGICEITLIFRLIQILGIPIGLIILYFFPFQNPFLGLYGVSYNCWLVGTTSLFESFLFSLPYFALMLITISVWFYATNIYKIIKKSGGKK
jgi:hypothetical protein